MIRHWRTLSIPVVLTLFLALVIGIPPEPDITGRASDNAWPPGEAAAGPALRAALGDGWLGSQVRVCRVDKPRRCVTVRLTKSCECEDPVRSSNVIYDWIIDLDVLSFSWLSEGRSAGFPVRFELVSISFQR
jgi:hypothetical protein